jgi:hypothetical protein
MVQYRADTVYGVCTAFWRAFMLLYYRILPYYKNGVNGLLRLVNGISRFYNRSGRGSGLPPRVVLWLCAALYGVFKGLMV